MLSRVQDFPALPSRLPLSTRLVLGLQRLCFTEPRYLCIRPTFSLRWKIPVHDYIDEPFYGLSSFQRYANALDALWLLHLFGDMLVSFERSPDLGPGTALVSQVCGFLASARLPIAVEDTSERVLSLNLYGLSLGSETSQHSACFTASPAFRRYANAFEILRVTASPTFRRHANALRYFILVTCQLSALRWPFLAEQ